MLFKVNQWVGKLSCDDVACEHDLFRWEKDDEITARMRRCPMVQLDLDAIDLKARLVLRDGLRREMISGRRATAKRRSRKLPFNVG